MSGPGRFKIDPNPPIAGQPAKVTYSGTEGEVEWEVLGQPPPRKVKIPPDHFEIDPVPRGDALVLSDNKGEGEIFDIDETSNH